MREKLIFLDVDGTLVPSGSNDVPESALRAVREAREEGHRVFLCSGRNRGMLEALLSYPWDGYIASSGGYITCGGRVLENRVMSGEEKAAAISNLSSENIFLTLECLDRSYIDERLRVYLEEHRREPEIRKILGWRIRVEENLNIRPMAEYRGEEIYKIVMIYLGRDSLDRAKKEVGDRFDFVGGSPLGGGFYGAELVKRGMNKGNAIRAVCRHLNIDTKDAIGFGDSANDLEMMETVGIAVSMEEGEPELVKMADYICPPLLEDGLARMFKRLGLTGSCGRE